MIYLDNAATTFPKPESVYRAATAQARLYGGNPGRSGHRLSMEAAKTVYRCRESIASLFGGEPEGVVFTQNATYALNMAITALYTEGTTAVISGIEHNAVLRPIAFLTNGRYRVVDPRGDKEAIVRAFDAAIDKTVGLVVLNHASNLCSLTLPVKEIVALCRKRGVPTVLDLSQSAGRLPFSLADCPADAVCAPGHKGLYGLQGCGFALFFKDYIEDASRLNLFVSGGNGVNSKELYMPSFLPERMEAGTLPTPAIASLATGIEEVKRIGIAAIAEKEAYLGKCLREALGNLADIRLYGDGNGGTVLFNRIGVSSEKMTADLDREGIAVRGGFHCCPLGHRFLGTEDHGAVRASFSYFNSKNDVDALAFRLSRRIL